MLHGFKVGIVACRVRQVVYQDLRQALLEEVYRHSVQQARLGPVLEQLGCAAFPFPSQTQSLCFHAS
jgi:hypothetical protein